MLKKGFRFSVITVFSLLLYAPQTFACATHLYLNPDDYGFIGGSMIRMAGLAPPEPAFKIKHPPTTKVEIGELSEIVVSYKRPWRSKNVTLQLKASKNIELIDKNLALEDFDSSIPIRFKLIGKGYNNITLSVSGEHKGEMVSYSSKIFIGANAKKQQDSLQSDSTTQMKQINDL